MAVIVKMAWKAIALLAVASGVGVAQAQLNATPIPKFDHSVDPVCGGLANAHGPFDYRQVNQDEKDLVEKVHFNEQERMLDTPRGYTDRLIWGEFDYTLRAFPNHPRALAAIDKLSRMLKTDKPRGNRYSAECYFKRAVKFAPDDGMVRLLYGLYLVRRNRISEGLAELTEADRLAPNDVNVQYNIGLAYFMAKEYDKSREFAKKAYEGGFPLPGLRNLLQKAGQWE